ncbi:alpha/beta hydrolase family protein [Pseudogracilibacillus auburnensis]|uniref:Pimeloyl-ACP methyl ester carboxylesterase n=1 Tax=Pseudogracilibacillus auburnensis TaxID=1494959 RepID=A0A2V3VQX5_9BACI|nr:alpha/beta hydrolase [Pseudogracilibacillus auburnensis]PXW83554.1 pimeloyl-ACP methyl ester carboxylesterase [Pseudogracilibacillus auburnensis]
MTFENIFDDVNFNYQANRVLSHGDIACKKEEIYSISRKIVDTETWYEQWRNIAEVAEKEKRYIHSMYYYRMAEFMLKDNRPEKDIMYRKMMEMFEKGNSSIEKHKVPYKNGYIPCLSLGSQSSGKTLLIHGGYDSFIEEFYPICHLFIKAGYHILLFEGEGQGETLRQHMKFNEQWENTVGAILDWFKVDQAALMGISWGGFLALRAAAFEKRITHVISFGGCYDGLDVQFSLMRQPIKIVFKLLFHGKFEKTINRLVKSKMKKDPLADWALSHGMYITGTKTPYEFYRSIKKHTLKGLLHKIDQKVLLLAGEQDHYIPLWQHDHLTDHLSHADVTSRLFTEEEGGEQHCQVGNYELALEYILTWLRENY